MSIDEREDNFHISQANKKSATKKILNGKINGNEFQEAFNYSVLNLNAEKEEQEYYRWDNLIHIEIVCFIGDFLLKEEFLWERTNVNVKDIKEFAITMLMENEELNRKVRLSYEFIEVASEFITSKILQEIKFYQRFDPYANSKKMFLEKGYGVGINAHLINIEIDLKYENINYKDHLVWDIINPENIPELFSQQIVSDFNLPLRARNLIALIIRRSIKEYIFKIFRSLTALYPNINAIKNDVFLTSLISDINSLKSFLNSVKQNTQNLQYKFPLNVNSGLINKTGSIISNRGRKGRGGRYKNDFKNSFLFKSVNNHNNNSHNNTICNNTNTIINGNLNLNNEVNNTDYSDNFEATAAEKNPVNEAINRVESYTPLTERKIKNGFGEAKALGRRRKSSTKKLSNEYGDLNLSLNEDSVKFKESNNSNKIDTTENIIKKPRGRRKIIRNEDNFKLIFEIPLNNLEVVETNKNIVFFDLNKIVILKEILDSSTDDNNYDRFIIEKIKLEKDILDDFS